MDDGKSESINAIKNDEEKGWWGKDEKLNGRRRELLGN